MGGACGCAALFEEVGLPAPGKAPLMRVEHQIAQKIHAVTSGGDRARDLADLQLIARNCDIDLVATKRTCARLFAYRRAQAWPPVVEKRPGWDALYAEQASGLSVLQSVEEAVEWVDALIGRIDSADRQACKASARATRRQPRVAASRRSSGGGEKQRETGLPEEPGRCREYVGGC